jgi:protein-S-isoprenylcysteine O-methyltransferase Ste14
LRFGYLIAYVFGTRFDPCAACPKGRFSKIDESMLVAARKIRGEEGFMSSAEEPRFTKHKGRFDLTGEHPIGDTGQIALFLLFMVVWIADSFFLGYTDFLATSIPLYIRLPIAAGLLVVAVLIAKSGHDTMLGEVREEAVVVQAGAFALVRHPLYLGTILFYVGLSAITFSLAAVAVMLVACMFYHSIARYEEKLLLARFGDEYRKYMKDVPMWVPRLTRRT